MDKSQQSHHIIFLKGLSRKLNWCDLEIWSLDNKTKLVWLLTYICSAFAPSCLWVVLFIFVLSYPSSKLQSPNPNRRSCEQMFWLWKNKMSSCVNIADVFFKTLQGCEASSFVLFVLASALVVSSSVTFPHSSCGCTPLCIQSVVIIHLWLSTAACLLKNIRQWYLE